jgi:isocitrate dehydrogenase
MTVKDLFNGKKPLKECTDKVHGVEVAYKPSLDKDRNRRVIVRIELTDAIVQFVLTEKEGGWHNHNNYAGDRFPDAVKWLFFNHVRIEAKI